MNKLNHIAFIMDGNGRWGKKKEKSRNFGHINGVNTVKKNCPIRTTKQNSDFKFLCFFN